VISTYLQTHAPQLVNGKTILELGAGAGLPSLVAAILGANKVVVTDYPDADLVENIRENIDACCGFWRDGAGDVVVAEGYLWGAPTASLVQHLPRSQQRFDILLLADLLFNHHCHAALVSTIVQTLARTAKARALVFFTPYRPWLLKKDLDFFDLCGGKGLVVEKVVQERMKKVMFVEDRGDEILRRTVFGYEVYWRDLRGGGAEELWL